MFDVYGIISIRKEYYMIYVLKSISFDILNIKTSIKQKAIMSHAYFITRLSIEVDTLKLFNLYTILSHVCLH